MVKLKIKCTIWTSFKREYTSCSILKNIVELEPLDIKEDKIISTNVTSPSVIGTTVTKLYPVK